MLFNCDGLKTAVNKFVVSVDKELKYLGANDFLKYLHDHVKSITGEMSYETTAHHNKHMTKSEEHLRMSEQYKNNAGQQPKYVFLVPEAENFNLILSALIGQNHAHVEHHVAAPIKPSSTLIFEIVKGEKEHHHSIQAFYNDEEVILQGCDH